VTDETRARFLGAIAAQLPAERIVEVHLFPAIRQGGMESGVAVLAVQRAGETDETAPNEADAEVAPMGDDAESLRARRYTVYSARYRHTLKGPERGKWEVNVTEEADAPLLTIDAVVRGVQRRSGDAEEIVRLSGDEVRAVLPAPVVS
jgi:hypothetical protein